MAQGDAAAEQYTRRVRKPIVPKAPAAPASTTPPAETKESENN